MMRLELTPGSEVPWYYGLAYRRWDADATVFYPVPVHLIVRWSRRFWLWVRFSGVQNGRNIELRNAFNKGRAAGSREMLDKMGSAAIGASSLTEWLDRLGIDLVVKDS